MATTTIRDVDISNGNIASNNGKNSNNNSKARRTFMLHAPDMTALGRFVSTDWRYAALKAASRGHTDILLRQTGTQEVRRFEGTRIEIPPKEINRGGRVITYTNRPQVKFVNKFLYSGKVNDDANVPNNPTK